MITSVSENFCSINFRKIGFIFMIAPLGLGTLAYSSFVYSAEDQKEEESSPRNSRIPLFYDNLPSWGVELAGSLSALRQPYNTALTSAQGTNPTYSFSVGVEYQSPLLQRYGYGILGIGPSFALYPIFGGNPTSNVFSLLSLGGQIRYQARYFREQAVVPVIGYALEYLKYQFNDGTQGGVLSKGPVLGLWILTNILEPSSAAEMYISTGILRTYLIFEYRFQQGSDSNLSFNSGSFYFGLRFEF